MLNSETVTYVAVVTTDLGMGNESTVEAAPVTLTALVAIGDTREAADNRVPDLTVDYALYFLSPSLPAANSSGWFTVRGQRCEVSDGPNGRWGSMGEVVAVTRTGVRP